MVDEVRILICGGRDYTDYDKMWKVFSLSIAPLDGVTIIHGGADGADKMAGNIAQAFNLTVEDYPISDEMWKEHGKWEAPKMRNQDMLDTGIDLVYGFPGGPGTLDMKKRAKAENVLVLDVW